MIEIGSTLPFPFQMTCIDSKVRDVIPIPGILTDLEINLDENSGVKQYKLYLMCFNNINYCMKALGNISKSQTFCNGSKNVKLNFKGKVDWPSTVSEVMEVKAL